MKRNNILTIYILFGIMLLFTSLGRSQEEIFFLGEELGVGTRAMSMGGAYVGIADDYSAIYWNPAGLGQMRRMELNIGFSHNKIANNVTFLDNNFNAPQSFTRLNSLGFVFPVPTYRGSLVFGIGYNKVRDFDNVLELQGFNPHYAAFADIVVPTYDGYSTDILNSLYQTESIIEEGSLNHFSFAGAVEVQKNFFLGATINFVGGTDDYNVRFKEEDIYNLYNTPLTENSTVISDLDFWNYNQNITSKFSATNIKLGAFYRMGRALRLGATVVTPTRYKIKESWSENWDEYYDGVVDPESFSDAGEYEYTIEEPYGFGFGASFRLLNILLSGGFDFKDWSQAKFRDDPPIAGMTKADVNVRIKTELQPVTNIRLGAEMYIPFVKIRVRAGYFTKTSPYKYADVKPNKEFLTAGLSMMLDKQVMVDVGLVHGAWKQETIDNLTQIKTLEDRSFDKIVGTLSIRF